MSEPFVGEIRMFAGNFAPRCWAYCDGQLLAVSQNDTLFSLLGTIYGGDGRTTFGLPDLRGRFPMHAGNGSQLSNRRLGEKEGAEQVTLTAQQLPSHSHKLRHNSARADSASPVGNIPATSASGDRQYSKGTPAIATMNPGAIANTGGGASHPTVPPFICVHFIIALFGVYPSRS